MEKRQGQLFTKKIINFRLSDNQAHNGNAIKPFAPKSEKSPVASLSVPLSFSEIQKVQEVLAELVERMKSEGATERGYADLEMVVFPGESVNIKGREVGAQSIKFDYKTPGQKAQFSPKSTPAKKPVYGNSGISASYPSYHSKRATETGSY